MTDVMGGTEKPEGCSKTILLLMLFVLAIAAGDIFLSNKYLPESDYAMHPLFPEVLFEGAFSSEYDEFTRVPLTTTQDRVVSNNELRDCYMSVVYSNQPGEREYASVEALGTNCYAGYSVKTIGNFEVWVMADYDDDSISFVAPIGVPIRAIALRVCRVDGEETYHSEPEIDSHCLTVLRVNTNP